MVDRAVAQIDHVPTVPPVVVCDLTSPPVFGGDKGDGRGGESEAFPPFHFIDLFKSNAVHEIPDPGRNDDGLVGGNPSQTAAIEVVKMSVRDQHQINIGQVMMQKAGVPEAPDDQKPVGPIGINQDIAVRTLDQKRGMPNPRDGDLALPQFGKDGGCMGAVTAFARK